MFRKLLYFFVLLLGWCLFGGSFAFNNLAVGAVVAASVLWISCGFFAPSSGTVPVPTRKLNYFMDALMFLPVYLISEIKALLHVSYLILHPGLPLRPAIIRLPSRLKSDLGLTVLAVSITMVPGTLAVDVDEDRRELYVHWIAAGNKGERPR